MGEQPRTGPGRTFAQRLEYLFETVHGRDGEALTMDQVAARIAEQGDEHVSAAYLSALRRGVRDNPTLRTIEALARCFGVPPSYFLDDGTEERVRDQLSTLAELRGVGVKNIKFRGADLVAESRAEIITLLQELASESQAVAARMLDVVGAIEAEGAEPEEEDGR